MKMHPTGTIDYDPLTEGEIIRKRLLNGKCALCGKEKTVTPGITIGKKCWAAWMKEYQPEAYKEMIRKTKKGRKR